MTRARLLLMLGLALAPGDPPAVRPEMVERLPSARLVFTGVSRPNGLMARADAANPILRGKNLYAPDFVRNGGAWNLYYGGWRDPADVNDRIYAAVSRGPAPVGPWAGQMVIIDNGRYSHVNDPSVVRRQPDEWFMAFTVNRDLPIGDRIAIAFSRDGLNFAPRVAVPEAEIVLEGPRLAEYGRPCLLWTGSKWKLWFDGQPELNKPAHSYLAECADPIPKRFKVVYTYPDIDNFPGFMEPDVAMVGDQYVAVVRRGITSLRKLVSRDGVKFDDAGEILNTVDPAFGHKYVTNPGWIEDGQGTVLGVGFGMTDKFTLETESIGVAWHQLKSSPVTPGGVADAFARALGPDACEAIVTGHTEFSRLIVEDPPSLVTLYNGPVSMHIGERWRIVRDPSTK